MIGGPRDTRPPDVNAGRMERSGEFYSHLVAILGRRDMWQ